MNGVNERVRRGAGSPWRACMAVGLVWGAGWGWLQALGLGLADGSGVGLREWAAALAGSAMIHALCGLAHGFAAGLLGRLVRSFVSRAQRIERGPFAVGAFAGGAAWLVAWPALGAAAAAAWPVGFALALAGARRLAPTPAGIRAAAITRRASVPLALLLCVWMAGRIAGAGSGADRDPARGAWRQAWAAARDGAPAEPSIVLIVLGSTRADRLGCYGRDPTVTPQLDDLAADALVFERAYAPATRTAFAQAAILAGTHPVEADPGAAAALVDPATPTLAEALARREYETVAFRNGPQARPSELERGFDRIVRPRRFQRARDGSLGALLERAARRAGWPAPWVRALIGTDSGAGMTQRLVRRWLDGRDRDRPFFLFVEYAESEPLESADARVGEMLALLSTRVALDRTLLIVTSDRGALAGARAAGHGVDEALTRVPLIVRLPSRARPGRSAEVVQTVDIPPTALDAAAGGPLGSTARLGRSLLPPPGSLSRPAGLVLAEIPGLRAAELRGRVAVARGEPPEGGGDPPRALWQGPWKYVRETSGGERLYRVADDPHETADLAAARPEIVEALRQTLDRWLASLSAARVETR